MYRLKRNGIWSDEIEIVIRERPDIPCAEQKYTKTEIPNKSGDLFQFEDTVEDISIDVVFVFSSEADLWQHKFREIKKWLFLNEDNTLKFSDDSDYFYKVKHTKVKNVERKTKRIGVIETSFVCEGYQYSEQGQCEISSNFLINDGCIAHPVYKILGEGVCEIAVNGKKIVANVGQNLTINTDLMLSYRDDGTLQNASITGDYENLYFSKGNNNVNITSGFTLKIIPNWRYL